MSDLAGAAEAWARGRRQSPVEDLSEPRCRTVRCRICFNKFTRNRIGRPQVLCSPECVVEDRLQRARAIALKRSEAKRFGRVPEVVAPSTQYAPGLHPFRWRDRQADNAGWTVIGDVVLPPSRGSWTAARAKRYPCFGGHLSILEMSKKYGLSRPTIWKRLRRGLTPEEAVTFKRETIGEPVPGPVDGSKLTILGSAGKNRRGHKMWVCRCECGVIKSISAQAILSGTVVSCGCFARNKARSLGIATGRKHEFFGEELTLREISEVTGTQLKILQGRVNNNDIAAERAALMSGRKRAVDKSRKPALSLYPDNEHEPWGVW